jgi:hypothetical protein
MASIRIAQIASTNVVLNYGARVSETRVADSNVSVTLNPITDSSTGSDNVDITVNPSISETAGGTELISVSVLIQITESSIGTDTVAITSNVKIYDQSESFKGRIGYCRIEETRIASNEGPSDTDYITATPRISISDSASGSEIVVQGSFVYINDNAAGTDSVPITFYIPITDSGLGTDIFGLSKNVDISETATSVDPGFYRTRIADCRITEAKIIDSGNEIKVTAKLTVSDSATGSEVVTFYFDIRVSDTSIGSEAIAIPTVLLPVGDSGLGLEQLYISRTFPTLLSDPVPAMNTVKFRAFIEEDAT